MIPYLPNNKRLPRLEPPLPVSSDLQSQFEELLSSIWAAEANWRFDDKLDMALKVRQQAA